VTPYLRVAEPWARRAWPPFFLCASLVLTWLVIDQLFSGTSGRDVFYTETAIRGYLTLLIVLALQIFSGNSGVLSFGHVTFVAIGAYMSALLTIPPEIKDFTYLTMEEKWPWLSYWILPAELSTLEGTLAGAGVAMLFAIVFAPAIVRLAGVQAGIATLALLVITNVFIIQTPSITRGTSTLIGVPPTTTLLGEGEDRDLYGSVVLWSLICVAIAFAFQQSRHGLRLRATRENARAARSVGVSVPVERAYAWVLSGFVAGVAGALYGHAFGGTFSPQDFYFNTNGFDIVLLPIAMLVIGGMTSVTGAVVGCYFLTVLYTIFNRPDALGITEGRPPSGTANLMLGFALLVVLALRPRGLTGGKEVPWPTEWSLDWARRLPENTRRLLRGEVRLPAPSEILERLRAAFGGGGARP
jgi:branched-chain amino acid transport system permease protein